MRVPEPTPEQLANERHVTAAANGLPCRCPRCIPSGMPRNRRELRALVTTMLRYGYSVRDMPRRIG